MAESRLATEYMAMAVRGDLREAERLFAGAGPAGGSADAELAAHFEARFIDGSEAPPPPVGDAGVDAVLTAYRRYWKESLLRGEYSEAELHLQAALGRALLQLAPGLEATSGIYDTVQQALSRTGLHALADFAPPLQDLIVWTRQHPERFTVDLGDQVVDVEVLFLSGFLSQGWKHYASLDLATTTGWVADGWLYCVEWAYRPGSEAFEVSFLKHEGRHLVDYRRFPGLEASRLEYRGKLTELAFARTSLPSLLEDFRAKSAADSNSPHAEANARVINDLHFSLYGRGPDGEFPWTGVEVWRVNRTALQLLQADTQLLEEEYASRP